MLPGFLGDARVFAALTDLGDQRPVMALNLPEHGHTIAELATEVLIRITVPRFAVIGLSLGGLIGWAMSLQAPERVAHLITVGTLPDHSLLPEDWARTRLLSRWTPFFAAVYRHRLRGQLRHEGVGPDETAMLTEELPARTTVMARSAAIDTWGLDEAPPVPTNWLRGQVDGLAPWTARDVQHHLPDVAFETIPGGHYAPLTHPGPFTQTVRRILDGHAL